MKKFLLILYLCLQVNCESFKDFELKVVWSNSFMGSKYKYGSTNVKQDVVDGVAYMKTLGYSHILHYIDGPNEFIDEANGDPGNFIKKPSGWAFYDTDFDDNQHYTQLVAMKELVEDSNGLTLIPSIPGISWVGYFIAKDESIAEDTKYVKGATGWAYVDEHGKNEAMDQFAELYAELISKAWDDTMPPYVCLGFDELERTNTPGGKTDQLNTKGYTTSELIVKVIINRMKLVDDFTDGTLDGSAANHNTKFILWGDSFAEGDNGEIWGLTGENGVLSLLKRNHRSYFDRMIIMPWRYGVVDGTYDIGGKPQKYDKKRVINYLNNEIGVKYIFLTGEGSHYTAPHWPNESGNVVCLFEWLQAAANNSENWVGVGISSWTDNSNWSGHQFTPASWAGVFPPLWTAPVLSYLAFENNSKIPELANLSNGIDVQRLKRFIDWESCRKNTNYIFEPLNVKEIKRPSSLSLLPFD